MKKQIFSALLALLLIAVSSLKSQTVHIYRPTESMMSGGRSMDIKMLVNDQEAASIQTGTALH
jgi:hypothetical protein